MILYTIGHSNLSLADFLRALKDHDISYIVDVRSSPASVRFPYFSRPDLAASLQKAGIDYLYMGDQLGGKPAGVEPHGWKQGKVNPHTVSNLSRTTWTKGLETLDGLIQERAAEGRLGCLLCSEGNANNCHRLLIAFELVARLPEMHVEHIVPRTTRRAEAHFQKTLL